MLVSRKIHDSSHLFPQKNYGKYDRALPLTPFPPETARSTWKVPLLSLGLHLPRALKSREERIVTPARGAAMIGPMYSLRENRAQHGGGGFHLHLSTL